MTTPSDSSRVLVFLHIPKTAGTSLCSLLADRFDERQIFHVRPRTDYHGPTFSSQYGTVEDLQQRPDRFRDGLRCVMGHFWYGVDLPFGSRAEWVTVLRDPVERAMSQLAQRNRAVVMGHLADSRVLPAEEIQQLPVSQISDCQTRILCGWDFNAHSPAASLERAIENLESAFRVVGTQEQFATTLRCLERSFGLGVLSEKQLNMTPVKYDRAQLSSTTLAWLEEINTLDRRLHDYASQRLRRQFRQFSLPAGESECQPKATAALPGSDEAEQRTSPGAGRGLWTVLRRPKWKILFDGSKLTEPRMDGIRRYIEELLKSLAPLVAEARDGWNVDVTPDGIRTIPLSIVAERLASGDPSPFGTTCSPAPESRAIYEFRRFCAKWRRSIRKRLPFPRRDDSYHLLHLPLPSSYSLYGRHDIPRVVTVHDVSHVVCPDLQTDVNRKSLDRGMQHAIDRNARYIADSASTRRDMIGLLGIPADRIRVVHLATDRERFQSQTDQAALGRVRTKYGLPEEPFILTLCTLEPRKNLQGVVRACQRLIATEPDLRFHLVIAGPAGWGGESDKLKALCSDRIHLIGRADDEDLAALYCQAAAFVCMSFYEGFCLPILEAMSAGCPVIHSDRSAMPEVAGEAGLSASPSDLEEIARRIQQVLCDDAMRDRMRQQGLERADQFSWRRTATQTLDAYEACLSEFVPESGPVPTRNIAGRAAA